MVRGGYLPVKGSKGIEWKYYDDLGVCGTKETEIHVLFDCKCYDMVRRKWLRTWDGREGKINGCNKRICGGERRCGERVHIQRDNEIFERNRVNVIP